MKVRFIICLMALCLGLTVAKAMPVAPLPDGVLFRDSPLPLSEMGFLEGRWANYFEDPVSLRPLSDGRLRFSAGPPDGPAMIVYLTRRGDSVYFSYSPNAFWASISEQWISDAHKNECFRVGKVERLPSGGLALSELDPEKMVAANNWLKPDPEHMATCDFGFLFGLGAVDQARLAVSVVSPEKGAKPLRRVGASHTPLPFVPLPAGVAYSASPVSVEHVALLGGKWGEGGYWYDFRPTGRGRLDVRHHIPGEGLYSFPAYVTVHDGDLYLSYDVHALRTKPERLRTILGDLRAPCFWIYRVSALGKDTLELDLIDDEASIAANPWLQAKKARRIGNCATWAGGLSPEDQDRLELRIRPEDAGSAPLHRYGRVKPGPR